MLGVHLGTRFGNQFRLVMQHFHLGSGTGCLDTFQSSLGAKDENQHLPAPEIGMQNLDIIGINRKIIGIIVVT